MFFFSVGGCSSYPQKRVKRTKKGQGLDVVQKPRPKPNLLTIVKNNYFLLTKVLQGLSQKQMNFLFQQVKGELS